MAKEIKLDDIFGKDVTDASKDVRIKATILEKALKDFNQSTNNLKKLLEEQWLKKTKK